MNLYGPSRSKTASEIAFKVAKKNELWRYTVQQMGQTCRTWATAFRAIDYYILSTQVHVHISEGTRHGFSVPVAAWKSSHRVLEVTFYMYCWADDDRRKETINQPNSQQTKRSYVDTSGIAYGDTWVDFISVNSL